MRSHPHNYRQAVQTDAALVRAQDPAADVQGVGQGAAPPRVLPRPRHRHIRLARLLRREDTGQWASRQKNEVLLRIFEMFSLYLKVVYT